MPLQEAVGPVMEVLVNAFVVNEAFRWGFCSGIILSLVVGLISRYLLYFLKPIRDFFKPSSAPATNKGPSSFERMMSCFTRVLVVLFVFVLFTAMFLGVFGTP